jgi:hypothetical protein
MHSEARGSPADAVDSAAVEGRVHAGERQFTRF